tara:strand:- start:20552 stop:22474 length:1923 start_codon:yes stop_codon:yes gene_type:complete
MATKFGYVRREATNQLDWGAIATQFTSIINEEGKVRAKRKAEIDRASREMVETLENAPTGEYVDGNQFALDYANDAQQLLLTQDRLLKQGILKPRDYAVVRANLNSSNKSMFKLGQAYQDAYKEKMERMNSDDPATRSQALESWKMQTAEGLYNIRNSKALINPANGMVSIGLWKDGKMDTDPSSYQTVPELMGNLAGKYDYFDVRKSVNTAVEDLGMIDEMALELAGYQGGLDRVLKTTSQGGKYSKDNKILNEYREWTEYTAEGMMSNPFNITSVLTNENLRASNGEQFTFTYESDPKKRKPNEIYLDRTTNMGGEPKFTKDQEGKVKEAIIQRLNNSVDKKITASTSRVPFDNYTRAQGDNNKKDENSINMLSDIYYGNPGEVGASETYFRDLLGAQSVRKDGDIIYVTDAQGVTKPVPMKDADGNMMDFETFAQSAVLLTGNANISDSVDLGGGRRTGKVSKVIAGDEDGTYIVEFEDGRKETRPMGQDEDITDYNDLVGTEIELTSIAQGQGAGTTVVETPLSQANRYFDRDISYNIFRDQNESDALEALEPLISMFGFDVEEVEMGSNTLEISKGGKTIRLGTNEEYSQASKNQKRLIDFLNANTSASEAEGLKEFLNNKVGTRDNSTGKGKYD